MIRRHLSRIKDTPKTYQNRSDHDFTPAAKQFMQEYFKSRIRLIKVYALGKHNLKRHTVDFGFTLQKIHHDRFQTELTTYVNGLLTQEEIQIGQHTIKLQKPRSYTYTTTSGQQIEYHKNIITIPEKLIQILGWQPNMEMKLEVNGDKLIISQEAPKN